MGQTVKQTVTAGATSSPIFAVSIGASVTLAPGASGSMSLQYTTSPENEVLAGTAVWVTWDKGTVTANTTQVIDGAITAVRASAVTSNGVIELRAE